MECVAAIANPKRLRYMGANVTIQRSENGDESKPAGTSN